MSPRGQEDTSLFREPSSLCAREDGDGDRHRLGVLTLDPHDLSYSGTTQTSHTSLDLPPLVKTRDVVPTTTSNVGPWIK